MSRTHTRPISHADASVLGADAWKYAKIGDLHIRINPLDADAPITPEPHLNQNATIELLDAPDNSAEPASEESLVVIQPIFADVLT